MIKHFKKIHKDAMELTDLIAKNKHTDMTEDDLDTLAEAIIVLNDAYDTLYDEVFVEIDDLK
jgi:hypothetical protein